MTDAALRQQLDATPDRVLASLPVMGKVMTVASDGGVTHERIGQVETIRTEGDEIVLTGATHDCRLDVSKLKSVVADRSGKMKDKVLPKLEFLDAGGKVVLGVVALDGLDKFDFALMRFAGSPVEARTREQSRPATLPSDDPGLAPLNAAHKSETAITIEMQKAGLVQRWNGRVAEINPAMGFINIIVPDFHLHVRGGTIATWDKQDTGDGVKLTALDTRGQQVGLSLLGPREAFEGA